MLQLSKFMQNPPSSTQNSYVDNSYLLLLIQVENNNILIIICREKKIKRFSEEHNQNYIASFFDNNKLLACLLPSTHCLTSRTTGTSGRGYRIRRLLSHTNFCIFTRAHKWISIDTQRMPFAVLFILRCAEWRHCRSRDEMKYNSFCTFLRCVFKRVSKPGTVAVFFLHCYFVKFNKLHSLTLTKHNIKKSSWRCFFETPPIYINVFARNM